MNYHPQQLYVWDAWCMVKGDEAHLFHLQRNRPDSTLPPQVEDRFGHAVSTNLVDWTECAPCLGPDPANPLDCNQPWTGCALWHNRRGYLYYTMRNRDPLTNIQHIGLAVSDDGYNWTRHPGNPVITPDPRWYATAGNPTPPNLVDCRDLLVIPHPQGRGWLGYYAARRPADELPKTSVIACVRSDDLIHWTHLPPAFAPNRYACIEVPDVFEMNGRWFMTCLTGCNYGNRGIFDEPQLTVGTIYAVAERPEGPFQELKDFVLMGAHTMVSPLSCRSVLFQGQRHALYTERETTDHTDQTGFQFGVLTTPKLVRTDGERLFLAYSNRIESHVRQELIGPAQPPRRVNAGQVWGQYWQTPTAQWDFTGPIRGKSQTGWGVAELGVEAESFIFEADLTLLSGVAAGLMIRMTSDSGVFVGLDRAMQAVVFSELSVPAFVEQRRYVLAEGQTVKLRIVQRREFVELYVNDELKLAFTRYRNALGGVGLFIDRADAAFANLRLRTLA